MLLRYLLGIGISAALAKAEAARGYPLFFASFEDVGEVRTEFDVLPVKEVDNILTEYMRGCPADAFVIIRDSSPFEMSGYKKIQRLAEQSLTRGSYLTDYMVNTHELALDLEEYCQSQLIHVDTDAPEEIESFIDTRSRVFYVDFDKDIETAQKDLVLKNILRAIPSPFVMLVYGSAFQQAHPIFRSVELDPNRKSWSSKRQRYNAEKIAPIIAPIFKGDGIGHEAPEPVIDLPDHFFLTMMLGSVFVALFLAYNDWAASKRKAPVDPSLLSRARKAPPSK